MCVCACKCASVSGSPQAPAVIGRASRGVEELARLAPPQQIEEQIHRDPGSRRKELWEKALRGRSERVNGNWGNEVKSDESERDRQALQNCSICDFE